MDVYCLHISTADSKIHARDHLKLRFGIEASCVRLEPHRSDAHPDLRRQFVHMKALSIAESRGKGGVFVEAGACPTSNPLRYCAGPPGLEWDMACMSGSVTSLQLTQADVASSNFVRSVARTVQELERDLERVEGVVLGSDLGEGTGTRARVVSGKVVGLAFHKSVYEFAKRRGPISEAPGIDLFLELYERFREVTYVKQSGDGIPQSSSSAKRTRWVRGMPTTLSCYCMASRGACSKALDLLRYTTSKSPLPNVLSYEKHVTEDRMACYVLLRPVCGAELDPVVDYIHLLSGLKNDYPLSRKPVAIRSAKMSEDNQSVYLGVLPESELPKVSILTITRNRRRIFNVAAYMVMNTNYPRDKLEWVIVDDSEDGEDCLPALGRLRDDPMVVYRRLRTEGGKPFRIGHKREISCQIATGDVFVHLDDDDFLPPMGVQVRVRAILEYGAQCVGSTYMLSHVYENGRTFFTTVADVYGDLVCFGEPSLAYTREFWLERRWNVNVHMDEGRYFLLGRDYAKFLNVPSHFHVVAITHGKNVTGTLRDGTNIMLAAHLKKEDIFPPDLIKLMDSVFRKD